MLVAVLGVGVSIKGGAVNITIDFTKTGGSATVTLKDNEGW